MTAQKQIAVPAILALSSVVVTGLVWPSRQGSAPARQSQEPELLRAVKPYKTWSAANEEPHMMSRYIDLLCRMPTPEEVKKVESDPHYHKFIRVYTNAVGAKAMKSGKDFPKGSIIVKEKRVGKDGEIELYTIMRKREKDYNPDCGDWEFATVDAKMSKITSQGKIEKCMSCHQDQKEKDYTFRTYLK